MCNVEKYRCVQCGQQFTPWWPKPPEEFVLDEADDPNANWLCDRCWKELGLDE